MNIIFLQEGYDPRPDPNSICVENLINEFSDRNADCFVICDGPVGKEQFFCNDNNICHVPIKEQPSYSKATIIQKIRILVSRICSIPVWPIRFPMKVKSYLQTLERLILTEKMDSKDTQIISVYRPAEMVEVGWLFKKRYPQFKWTVYNLDGFDTNVNFNNKEWFSRKETRWQYSRYEVADCLMIMETHRLLFEASVFAKYRKKTMVSDYPLLKRNIYMDENSSFEGSKKWLYAGSFYYKLREPMFMIELFKAVNFYNEYEFNIYTRNDFIDYIEEEEKKSNGCIKRCNYVTSNEMNKIIASSSILISVGNEDSAMVPSKILVYISSCKPIIHLYKCENDSCIPYLEKYPYALLLNENDGLDINVEKTRVFIKEFVEQQLCNYNQRFESIRGFFQSNSPEITVDLMEKVMTKM